MNKVHKVMREFKEGTLKSSSGDKVTSRDQAIAIALSEQRRKGKYARGGVVYQYADGGYVDDRMSHGPAPGKGDGCCVKGFTRCKMS